MEKIYLPHKRSLIYKASRQRRNLNPAEQILWNKLRRKKMLGYEFKPKVILENQIVDFFCEEVGLVIMIDKVVHNHVFKDDPWNPILLESETLNFNIHEVMHYTDSVCDKIERWITERKALQAKPPL